MKQFLITVAGVLVGLLLFVFIVPMLVIASIGNAASKHHASAQPSAIVLGLDLREPVTDSPSTSPFSFGGNPSVVQIVRTLAAAAKGPKVKGIYVRAATEGMAPAHAEEIRDALRKFRASNKWIIAHLQNDGVRTSMAGYAAIADANEIWLQDASEIMPMGITAEETFFADTLKRFHMAAQFEAREEYKSFADTFTKTGFTPANREATTSMLTGIYDQLITDIAESRKSVGLTPDSVRKIIESTPLSGEDAVKQKLVDKLGRPEDAETAAVERAGGEDSAGVVDISDYSPKPPGGPTIALVTGEGDIVSGPDNASPFNNEVQMNGETIANAILDASKEKDVKAIVFRVSSPGGSVVASDQIWNAVEIAKKRGKKVVVSMGAYAASGGYYVSAGADEIVAWPTTITGSIGVVGGKIVLGDAMQHYLSTHTETVQVGSPVANFFTSSRPFTNAESQAFSGFIDRAYQDFVGIVAKGRGLTPEQARAVAKGRVWTGQQALDRKLVNTMGGLDVAVNRAKALAGLKADQSVTLKLYPNAKSPFEAIEKAFGVSAEDARAAAVLGSVLGDERVTRALKAAFDEPHGARSETTLTVH